MRTIVALLGKTVGWPLREPAAAVVGDLAVPGDKSISHRAVLVGAIAEGETQILGFGRSADTRPRSGQSLGVEFARTTSTARVRGRGSPARRAWGDRLRERGRSCGSFPACSPADGSSSSSGRVAVRAPDGAGSRAVETDGRHCPDDGRTCAPRRRGRFVARDRLRAPGAVRAGQVRHSPRGAQRGRRDDRRRAAPDAGHGASPRARRRGGPAPASVSVGRRTGSSSTRSRFRRSRQPRTPRAA
jgi:hypothetical protein